MNVSGQQDKQTQLHIEDLKYHPSRCHFCGQIIRWCYTVRDHQDRTYIIGRQCAAKHVSESEARAWGAYFRRAEREWAQDSGETRVAYIQRRVKELATPLDMQVILHRHRITHAHELIADAIQQRLREIQRMLPEKREFLNLRVDLMSATFSILWQNAYMEEEIELFKTKRVELVEQAIANIEGSGS